MIISSKNHVIGKLFDALENGLNANKLYTVQSIKDTHFILNFTEMGKTDFRLNKVEFFAYGKTKKKSLSDIKKMTLEYIDNKRINLEFSKFAKKKSFNQSHFVFQIPKNTKIVKQ